MIVVAHNLAAMNVQRQFNITDKKKAKNVEKLSSGYKINRSADDAAGLSISEKMRNQIRGLNQGLENVENGIGYIQTAEGALNEIHSILGRMEELAVQAANDINSDEDRKSIDDEIQQLKEEMGTVFDKTAFNGKKIWEINNVTGVVEKQVMQTVYFPIQRRNINNNELNAIISGDLEHLHIDVAGTDYNDSNSFGFYIKRGDSNGTNGDGDVSRLISWDEIDYKNCNIKLSDVINETDNNLTSDVDTININWITSKDLSLQEVADAIDGVDFWTIINHYHPCAINTGDTNISNDIPLGRAMQLGLDIDNPNGVLYSAALTSMPSYTDPNEDTTWVIKYNNAVIGDFSCELSKIGVYEENDISTLKYAEGNTLNDIVQLIVAQQSVTDKNLVISAEFNNRRTKEYIDIYIGNNNTSEMIMKKLKEALNEDTIITAYNGSANYSVAMYPEQRTQKWYKSIQEETGTHDFYIQHGANAGEDTLISYDCLSVSQLGLINASVLSREEASQAITDIQEAVKKVSAQRSQFGAYQNRMEYIAVSNANYSENLQNAESNLRDTDMAKEMVDMSKNDILQQAAQSMLAHANQQNQGILQLIQS